MTAKNYVCYEDFGAIGDGIVNDFDAIFRAHEYANEMKLPIRATEGKKYRIASTDGRYATIKTDTDWKGAEFIIDDRGMKPDEPSARTHVFCVASDYEPTCASSEVIERINAAGGISAKEIKSLDLGIDYPAMAIVINKDHYNYIRWGGDANNGGPQKELVLLDADGNIDPSTPFLYDYDKVTRIEIIRTDVSPITITGGRFTFIACDVPVTTITYYTRNIAVSRSHTTIRGLEIYITNELADAAYPSYSGTLYVGYAHDTLIEDCVFTARKYYRLCGTYGIGAGLSNSITYRRCTQSNFFLPDGRHSMSGSEYWGLMGSNYCKNMTYDTCKLTRFDAHCGLYNGKIINSEIVRMSIIGGGNMHIENTVIYEPGNIICTRADYGCTWTGHILLKDVTIMNDAPCVSLISSHWVNHYFGYKTCIPDITIDNLKLKNPCTVELMKFYSSPNKNSLFYHPHAHLEVFPDGTKNENPMTPPSKIEVLNNHEGYSFEAPDLALFENTEFIGMKKVEFTGE